jgi:hypothetical protein
MTQMKRWLAAFGALVIGGGVSAALLVFANPTRGSVEAYVAAHDVPVGASMGADDIALERVSIASGHSLLFGRGDEAEISGHRASHDLTSGQLIQRSDVIDAGAFADSRLVFVPVKDAPEAGAGSKVDILVIGGTADRPTVIPFALGVEVRSAVSGGLVLVVSSRQATAFVYAADAMHLVAVIAEPGAAGGAEEAISSPDQAMAAAHQ